MVEWKLHRNQAPEHSEIARQAGMAVIITHTTLIRTYDFSLRPCSSRIKKVTLPLAGIGY